MSASISNAQNPPIAASQTAAAANSSLSGSSANVAAGPAPPTARSSYANATKKITSPPIASSAAPPVAVGGPQTTHHGKSASISPVNGSNAIKPAVPAMGPTIVNSSVANGTASHGDHSRKSSVTISAAGTSGSIPNGGAVPTRVPSNLTFGSLAGSPAPSHVTPQPQGQNLNPQLSNPRVASPAHSPSPIPTPISSGGKPDTLPTRPDLVFGGGSDSAESNSRPISLPQQPNSFPQAQHLRRESSQSAHSDMSNPNMSRGFPPNGGRGRGGFNNYPPMHPGTSPQPYRAMPNQPRGPNMPPAFQPMHPNSPYRANRSPAITPAAMHQQATYSGYNYGQQPYPQPAMYGPPQALDPYNPYYGQNYPGQNYGMTQGMHYPGVPASPGRGHSFPHQGYPVPGYGQPQAQGMSRTPSNISERPPSAAQQPSTPAMTNVSHVSQTPSAPSGSPAPASSFAIPAKSKSKAVVIKTTDGKVVDFKPKPASPAQAPPPPKSPAIVATPTPPPRPESTHSRTESVAAKSDSEKKAEFLKQFQQNLQAASQKEEADKKKEDDDRKKEDDDRKKEAADKKKAEEDKAEAEKAQKAKEEAEKAEADKAAKEKEAAEAAKADAEEQQRKADEEMERMIEEMERAEKEEEERERKFAEQRKIKLEKEKALEAERAKEADERMKQAEREAEAAEAARSQETPEQKAEREKLFASLKKNTMFGPAAGHEEPSTETVTPPAERTVTPPVQSKTTGAKPKPAHLKLETTKSVEPPAPTPGMMSLKSARFLEVQRELVKYPEGIQSPNPALNVGTKSKGKVYEPSFLLQFQDVFKEKPSIDWDSKLKETVGDSSESAGPKSARGSSSMGMGGRQPSRSGLGGPMGSFQGSFPPGGRTLPAGTTSEQRFAQSQRGPMTNPLAQLVQPSRPGGFPVQMARTSSFQNMGQAAPNSPRVGSSRGRGSRRGGQTTNRQDEKQMPLTSGMEIKALEKSTTGWTPHSKVAAPQQPVAGHMPPDMVQRKVKSNLNKLTPEKFEKISDQILEIAGQSKNEADGRTLRQVIQLTFEKACDEQHWSSMYAKFCHKMLMTMSTEIHDENVKDKHGNPVVGGALFRKYLLNRCQEEFEKGWEVNLPDKPEADGKEVNFSDEYYIAAAAKRKGLGLIQFIGELYKLNMLTLRIMHECVLKLLDFEGLPDESAIESLVRLLRTVGATMATADAGPKMLTVYFERIEKIMNMEGLPSRLRFMLLDLVDLRKANWHDKQADKGPKTIQQIHQEAAAAQQAAAQQSASNRGGRLPPGRGDARSFSGGGPPPPQDFGGRVAMDDLRKLSKNASGRTNSNQLGPSMLGPRVNSNRRGLGPGSGLMGGADSGASSRTGTPPVQKEKESTSHANSFSALLSLDSEGAGEVASPPSTAASPQPSKVAPARSNEPAADTKASE